MADNETTADIIAEMRGMGNYQRYSGDHARVLAGRLEAAQKRERENYDAKIADLQLRVKMWTDRSDELVKKCVEQYAKLKQVGNSAKLRDAVKSALDKLLLWNYTDRDTARMALGVMNKLEAALATTSSQNTHED